MGNYDYVGNANRQIYKYDNAIGTGELGTEYNTNIKSAISKYQECSKDLEKIKGIKSCSNLKKSIDLQIEHLNSKIEVIQSTKIKVKSRAKELERREKQQNASNWSMY